MVLQSAMARSGGGVAVGASDLSGAMTIMVAWVGRVERWRRRAARLKLMSEDLVGDEGGSDDEVAATRS